MDKATAQVIISQYVGGVAAGQRPNAASEASGLLSEYYLQGFDDGRNGTRKSISERKITHLDDADPNGIELVKILREAYSKIDSDADTARVYSKLMNAGQLTLDRAFNPHVEFKAPTPPDTLPGEPTAGDVERAKEILRRAGEI